MDDTTLIESLIGLLPDIAREAADRSRPDRQRAAQAVVVDLDKLQGEISSTLKNRSGFRLA